MGYSKPYSAALCPWLSRSQALCFSPRQNLQFLGAKQQYPAYNSCLTPLQHSNTATYCSSSIKLRLRNYLITWLYSKVCKLCSVWLQPSQSYELYGAVWGKHSSTLPRKRWNDWTDSEWLHTAPVCILLDLIKLVEHGQGPCVLSLLRRVSLCCSVGMSTTSCSLRIGMDQSFSQFLRLWDSLLQLRL